MFEHPAAKPRRYCVVGGGDQGSWLCERRFVGPPQLALARSNTLQ